MRRSALPCILFSLFTTISLGATTAPANGVMIGVLAQDQIDVGNRYTCVSSNNALHLHLNGQSSWYGVELPSLLDCSQYDGVAWTVTNNGAESANVILRLDSATVPGNPNGYAVADEIVPAGESRTYFFMFDPSSAPNGLCTAPPAQPLGAAFLGTAIQNFKPASLWRWMVWNNDATEQNLTVSQFQLINKVPSYLSLFDEYGQATWNTWSTKAQADSDLVLEGRQEQKELASALPISLNFPAVKLTGGGASSTTPSWSVAKSANGNWFLKTPTGRPFWSLGANQVQVDSSTQITGRLGLFAPLPAKTSAASADYFPFATLSGQDVTAFNFYRSNLLKKFGPGFARNFSEETLNRFSRWGLNTLGRWSSPTLIGQDTVYTIALDTNTYPTRLTVPNEEWNSLPDPFASDFSKWCLNTFTGQLKLYKGKPAFMGTFVDNELSWGPRATASGAIQIAEASLDAPASQPAHQAILKQLMSKYVLLPKLNAAWGTRFASWAGLKSATTAQYTPTAAYAADANQFVGAFAQTYFRAVRAALTSAAPGSLYLGCRLNIANSPDPVIAACAASTDVVSVNEYLNLSSTLALLTPYNRPILISEFGYVSGERGAATNMGGIVTTTEAQRDELIANYLATCGASPLVVGAHMFSWVDDPTSGRTYDGEAWTCGFLDVTDTPYAGVVSTFQNFAKTLPSIRR